MNDIIVSACIITYNQEKYIEQCLQGAVEQKVNFSYEIIIGDDYSTDRTGEIIQRYSAQYPGLIKYFRREKNLGMNKNWIETIKNCSGRYIAICEGDDYWTDPNKLQKQVDFLDSHSKFSLSFHNALIVYENGNNQTIPFCDPDQKATSALPDIIKKNFIPTASILFRKANVESIPGWFDKIKMADWALHILNARHGKLGYLNEIMSVYRIHDNGIWTSLSEEDNINAKIEFFQKINDYLNYKYDEHISINLRSLRERLARIIKNEPGLSNITEYGEFLNPEMSIENMDKYLVRYSILNAIKNILPELKGVLLDVGCGEMPYKKLLTSFPSNVEKYIGMDIENPLYQQNIKPDLFWEGNNIPLEDNSVDCVIATEFFEHVPYPEIIMEEISRVLKPEGVLFLTVPFIWSLHTIPNDEYRYTPFALERMLKKTGFTNINLKPLGGWNASLAQTIGLWARRKPMNDEERKKISESLFPFYKNLIETDQIPDQFTEGQLITGLSGTAVKIKNESDDADKYVNSFKKENTLAIFTPNFGTLSETFIKKHIDYLLPGKTVVVTGNIYDRNWANVPVLQIPYSEGPSKYSPEIEDKVESFLMQHKVTHILVEYGCYGTDIIELNSKKLNLPIFVHFHGGDAAAMLRRKEMVELYRWMVSKVNGVIAVAKPMAKRLAGIGIPGEKIVINHYGIDIPEHVVAQPEKSPCRFVFVGRLTPKKAPDITLKAFSKARSIVKNIHLDIVGDHFLPNQSTSMKAQLEDYTAKNNLLDAVTFHGAQSNKNVKEILVQSSAYVQHSVTVPETGDAEGLPNSILEASAYGLPVISTFHEGIPEEVENSKTGFLVNEFDIDAMAEYMIKLANNPELRKTMGLEGRKKIENEFSIEKSIVGLRKIIFTSQESSRMVQKVSEIRNFISKGNLEEAKELCYELLSEDTEFAEAYFLLGELNYASCNYEQASRNYLSAFQISGQRIDAAVKIVLSNLRLNRMHDAIRFLKQVIIENPYDKNLLLLSKELKVELQWEDLKNISSIKLYAGDIPEKEEYKNLIGLSIEKKDYRHIFHDVTHPFPLPDNSVDSFQAEDVFEHIAYEMLPAVLDEIYRVLKPGATFRLSIPDYGCDVLIERSIKDESGKIIFDPAGGGTIENPGHVWFPDISNVKALLDKTAFAGSGKINFLHHYNTDGTFVLKDIDYSKGFVMRNPDNDGRVQNPRRPMSLIVDLVKPLNANSNSAGANSPELYFTNENLDAAFPRLSFVMIVLNGKPFIEYTLNAIYSFAQEIIIVEGAVEKCLFAANPDGSSKDGTVELIKSFPDPDRKIRLVQGIWLEKMDMQNKALELVSGDYVWLVDSDEVYKRKDIEAIIKMLKDDTSITQINFIPDNFWKGFDYIFVSPYFFEKEAHYRRVFKFVMGAKFTSHRPPTLFLPGINKTTEELHTIDGNTTRGMGIYPYHYSYVLEEQVRQKIELYNRYGWGKSWNIDLNLWFNECYLKWLPENRTEIESKYPVWTGGGNSHTKLFEGEHPEVMKDFVESTRKRKIKIAGEDEKGKDLTEVNSHSAFSESIYKIFARTKPKKIIETGTYLGKGTTRIIAGALRDLKIDNSRFFSIEVNESNYRESVRNIKNAGLSNYVSILHGLSLPRNILPSMEEIEQRTVKQIEFDGIYVDHKESERAKLYYNETNFSGTEDDLLGKCLITFNYEPDFILLDSGGHIGNIEFNYLIERLRKECIIALDDINHIKHRSSFLQMKSDARFEMIISSDEKFGFCIAKFTPTVRHAINTDLLNSVQPNKILFVRTDSIGDNVIASSVLKELKNKFPNSEVTVVCQNHIAGLYENCPYIKNIIGIEKKKFVESEDYRNQIINKVREYKFDLAVNSVFSSSMADDMLALTSGAKITVRIDGDATNSEWESINKIRELYTYVVKTGAGWRSELKRYSDFLTGAGIHFDELNPEVWLAAEDEMFAGKIFLDNNIDPQKTIVLFAGAKDGCRHSYNYGKALSSFCRKNQYNVLAVGSEKDFEVNQKNLDDIRIEKKINLSGKTTIRQTAAIIKKCKLAAGAETGNAHIACAVGTPNLILLGGGHFGRFMPYSNLTSLVCHPLDCYGCNWNCTLSSYKCVEDVSVDLIEFALEQTLAKKADKTRIFIKDTDLPNKEIIDKYLEQRNYEVIEFKPNGNTIKNLSRINTSSNSQESQSNKDKFDFSCLTYSLKSHFNYFKSKRYDIELFGEEVDPLNCDLKAYQDLLVFTYIKENVPKGSRLLDIGGGTSRILNHFADEYECWNIDKFEGLGNGPQNIPLAPYKIVQDYIGNFNPGLPENYFDFVFSISTLEHAGEEAEWYKKICADIDRVSKNNAVNLHCFDVVLEKPGVSGKYNWSCSLLPFMFNRYGSQQKFHGLDGIINDPDLFFLSQKYYENAWQKTTREEYFKFGVPVSYNIFWQTKRKPAAPEIIIKNNFEKISIVTPSFNQAEFLEETIDSVLSQKYPGLEYVIMDGGSSDGSVDIIKKFEKYLTYWQSKKDKGQYNAINEGFLHTSGEIMGWINSDDKLHPESLFKINEAFKQNPQARWITGRPTAWNKDGSLNMISPNLPDWTREKILNKDYKDSFIQQESTFWKRSLWKDAGGYISTESQLVGDFELWLRFFRYEELYTVDEILGGYRYQPNQKTASSLNKYIMEADSLADSELKLMKEGKFTRNQPFPGVIKIKPASSLKQSAYNSAQPGADDFIMATSLNPNGGSNQQKAYESWLESGFRVVSFNCEEEISLLKQIYPDVIFFPVERTAYERAGKHLVYLDDILNGLKKFHNNYFGLINSDIILDSSKINNEAFKNKLKDSLQEGLVYSNRIDIDPDNNYEEEYKKGFDLYFFSKKQLELFNGLNFAIGLPWWDYYFILQAVFNSLSIFKINEKIAYHYKHSSFYSEEIWYELGETILEYVNSQIVSAGISGIIDNDKNDPLIKKAAVYTISDVSLKIIKSRSKFFQPVSDSPGEELNNDYTGTPLPPDRGIKVSAIVSTYNSERFIRGCLDDLLNQSLYEKGQLEIVVVNSGSQQNEEEIVKEYQSRFKNIQYIKTERETVYQAWNRGIKISSGKCITNANTDDRHRKDALEILAGELDANENIGLVYADQYVTKKENQTFENNEAAGYFEWLEFDRIQLIHCACIGPQPVWRKSLHERFGYFDESLKVAGDYEWWLRISEYVQLKHIPEKLGLYLLSSSSIEHKHENETKTETDKLRLHYARKANLNALDYEKYKSTFLTLNDERPPVVSVIIPTFNRPDKLKEAIASVRKQDYDAYEIIVVNDAGEDVSGVINSFNDKRIKLINHSANKGLAAARNTGLKNAHGKYIAYLDDDDVYYPEHLRTLLSFLEQGNYKIAYTDSYRATQELQNGEYVTVKKDVPFSNDFSKEKLLRLNIAPVQCFMHEKACVKDTGFFDESLKAHEDWDFWIRLSGKYDFYHIKKITSEFRQRTDNSNMTSLQSRDFYNSYRDIIAKHYLRSKSSPELLSEQVNNLGIIKQRAVQAGQMQRSGGLIEVSIIIPVYNKIEFTQQCLLTLYKNTSAEINFEVIVVDNASNDGTGQYLEFAKNVFTNLSFITNRENIGFAKANNLGVKNAKGEFVLFLNNDTEPLRGWLENLLTVIKSDKKVAAAGSKLLFPDGSLQHAGVIIIEDKQLPDPLVARHIYWKAPADIPEANRLMTYHALTAACLMVRKDVFNEVKEFDEEYWNGYEDVDLCFKLGEAGYKMVYQPASVVIHHESQSGPERFAKVSHNIDRLHKKWLSKIKPDFILEKNGEGIQTDAGFIRDYITSKTADRNKTSDKNNTNLFDASIIVLTYNGLEYTRQFLESIKKNTKVKYELILVDNCSSDGTVEFLKKFVKDKPGTKLILNEKNLGFPKGVNQGLKIASGKYIVIANNDIVVTKGWLERMIAAAEQEEKIGLVGPISNAVSGMQIDKDAVYPDIEKMHEYAGRAAKKNKGQILQFPRVAFLCTLIKREVIEKIGGLDERFSPGNYEDDDFCLRAQLAGFKTVIAKDVFIHHYGSKSFTADGVDKYKERLEINQKIFVDKWGATPEEIWLKGKKIKERNIMYALNKNEFTENLERALSLVEEKDYSAALRHLNNSISNYPEYDHGAQDVELAYLLNLAGNVSLIAGDVSGAQKYFEKALNEDSTSSYACSGLGDVLFNERNYRGAKTMYEWSLKNKVNNEAAATGLIKVNKLLNLPAADNSLLNASVSGVSEAVFEEVKPDPNELISEAFDLFGEKQFTRALEKLNQAERLFNGQLSHPTDKGFASSFHNMRGFNYLGLNDLENAKSCFEKALNLDPNSSQACAGLGETLFLEGHDEAAKAMFEWAVKNNSENMFAVGGLRKVNRLLNYPENHSSLNENGTEEISMKIAHRDDFGTLFNKLGLKGRGAEIGVQTGVYSQTLRQSWEGRELYLIDRWRFDPGYKDIANIPDEEQKENYMIVVEKFIDDDSVQIIRKDSLEAARQFPDEFFDWLYLDADHSLEGCANDLRAWYPKLKTGGIFAGHDYIDGEFIGGVFGVKSAVDGFISGLNTGLYLTEETPLRSWYFVKPADKVNLPSGIVNEDKQVNSAEQEKLQSVLNELLEASFELFGMKCYSDALETLNKSEGLFYSQQREELISSFENIKGFNYLGLNDKESARQCFEKALNLNPASSQACAGLGEVLYLSGKDEDSKTMYEYAVKNNPGNKFAAAGLAKVNKLLKLPENHNSLMH